MNMFVSFGPSLLCRRPTAIFLFFFVLFLAIVVATLLLFLVAFIAIALSNDHKEYQQPSHIIK